MPVPIPTYSGGKGGGGGSLGVVTRLTLRTRELPNFFGGVFVTIKAITDTAFRRLIGRFMDFYRASLFNPHWGEIITFRRDNTLAISMVFQGLDQQQANEIWRPFLAWAAESPNDFAIATAPTVAAVPARSFWDPEFLRKNLTKFIATDYRPRAPDGNIWWASNQGEVGFLLDGYEPSGCPIPCCRRLSNRPWPMVHCRHPALESGPAFQQRAGGRTG